MYNNEEIEKRRLGVICSTAYLLVTSGRVVGSLANDRIAIRHRRECKIEEMTLEVDDVEQLRSRSKSSESSYVECYHC